MKSNRINPYPTSTAPSSNAMGDFAPPPAAQDSQRIADSASGPPNKVQRISNQQTFTLQRMGYQKTSPRATGSPPRVSGGDDEVSLHSAHNTSPEGQSVASWTEEVPLETAEDSQTWETLSNASSIKPQSWFENLLGEEMSNFSAFTGSQKSDDEGASRSADNTSPEGESVASLTEEVPLKTTEGSQTWGTLSNANSIEPESWLENLPSEEVSKLSAFSGSQKPEDNKSVITQPPVANWETLKTDATGDAPKPAAGVTTIKDQYKSYCHKLTTAQRPDYSRLTQDEFEDLINNKTHGFNIPLTLGALVRNIDQLVNPEGEIKFKKEVVLQMASKKGFQITTHTVLHKMAKWTDPNGKYKLTPEQVAPLCLRHSANVTLVALDNYLPVLTDPEGTYRLTTENALSLHFSSQKKVNTTNQFFRGFKLNDA